MSTYDDASILMLPSGYKSSKLYSLKPTSGGADLSFARSTIGSRISSDADLDDVGIDTPRLDYTAGGCGKLLIEPQSTNLVTNSEPTSTGSFKTGVVFQQTNVFGFDGIYYLDNSVRRIAFFPTAITAGLQYTFSVFVKMADGSQPSINGVAVDDFRIWLGNVTTSNLKIIEIGDGIYRCSVSLVAGVSSVNLAIEKQTYNSAKAFEVSGFQLEAIEIPTSYIRTSGTTATRTQDTSQTSGGGVQLGINSEEGVLFIDFDRLGLDYEDSWMGLYSSSNSFNYSIRILYRKDRIIAYLRNNAGYQTIMQYYGTWTMPRIKVAFKWKVNDFALWANGVEGKTDTSGSTFPVTFLDTVNLGDYLTSSNPKFNSKINTLAVFPTALSDADLTTLTTL